MADVAAVDVVDVADVDVVVADVAAFDVVVVAVVDAVAAVDVVVVADVAAVVVVACSGVVGLLLFPDGTGWQHFTSVETTLITVRTKTWKKQWGPQLWNCCRHCC